MSAPVPAPAAAPTAPPITAPFPPPASAPMPAPAAAPTPPPPSAPVCALVAQAAVTPATSPRVTPSFSIFFQLAVVIGCSFRERGGNRIARSVRGKPVPDQTGPLRSSGPFDTAPVEDGSSRHRPGVRQQTTGAT